MDFDKVVTYLFNYFYYKVYKNPNFKLDLSVNNQYKTVDNFVKLLFQQYGFYSVGINLIIDYFCFSFHYWHDKKTKRKIGLGWIIGKKTFARFVDSSSEQHYYVQKWLKEQNINVDQLRQDLNQQHDDNLNRSEELEKIRFHGEGRLINCINNTTLYNHRSINCLGCEMKWICKKILKTKNPILFKQRGYGKRITTTTVQQGLLQ